LRRGRDRQSRHQTHDNAARQYHDILVL
jgi:hypothetical protein